MRALKFLQTVPWLMLMGIAAIPPAYSCAQAIESRFFPVVTDVTVEGVTESDEGITFYVAFKKSRKCEFVGISWYNGAYRVGVEFEPGSNLYPRTRPKGDQFAGPWLVRNVQKLDGTNAIAVHRCHPLWMTESVFYP